ncbi:hypothetical protein ACIHFD_34820 [Nonomuraea sp. NPDC051941]|uniref:hypothetical protein n=1 Tax=Nonomuraea sp. NPDC051941 TaxID=3364373 RepID=UPI0037C56DA4
MVPREEGTGDELAFTMVPTFLYGVGVSGAGTESPQVTLDNAPSLEKLLVRTSAMDGQLDVLLTAGFAWFQLLMTGSYLGAASALVERVLLNNQVPDSERTRLLVETEGAMSAAEGVARRIDDDGPDESTLADSLYVRYCVQDALSRIVPRGRTARRPQAPHQRADKRQHHLAMMAAAALIAQRNPSSQRETGFSSGTGSQESGQLCRAASANAWSSSRPTPLAACTAIPNARVVT